MRQCIACGALSAVLFCCVGAAAADFWKERPHEEWTEAQLLTILTDSPWAKTDNVPIDAMVTIIRPPRVVRPLPGRPGGYVRGGGAVTPTRLAKVYLRWLSALPVYYAMSRSEIARARRNRPGGVIDQIRKEPYHLLEVAGVPRFLLDGQLDELRLRASLRIRGLDPIHPKLVKGEPAGKTGSIRFGFPKDEAGGHTIRLDDREVEFQLKLEETTIKKRFKLPDMVYRGRLEI